MCGLSHMLDERLYYLVAVGHVCDHIFHVVLGRSDQSRPKHQCQITGLHLHAPGKKKDKRRSYHGYARGTWLHFNYTHELSFTHLIFI